MSAQGLFSGPIPGQSLTRSPDQKAPFELPPKFSNSADAMDHLLLMVFDKKFSRNFNTLVKKNKKMLVDKMASAILQKGFVHGFWTVDTMMLLVEPLIALLVWKAAQLDATVSFSTDTGYEDRTGFDYVIGQMFDEDPKSAMMTPPTGEEKAEAKDAALEEADKAQQEAPRQEAAPASPLLGGQ